MRRACLTDVNQITPPLIVDAKYATRDNFTGARLYPENRLFVGEHVVPRLEQVQREFAELGVTLVLWDAYRPIQVQHRLWSQVPDPRFVADPKKGSKHNRGCAVDVTIADFTGQLLEMPTGFDEFGPTASHDCLRVSNEARENRALLKRSMQSAGFIAFSTEWWHYDDPDWAMYEVLDNNPYADGLFPCT